MVLVCEGCLPLREREREGIKSAVDYYTELTNSQILDAIVSRKRVARTL